MIRSILASVLFTIAAQSTASASPILENLAAKCDAGSHSSCQLLAKYTNGQCSSPAGIGGCRYDSRR